MNENIDAAVKAALADQRERLAELMERQHTWISSVSAARLIRGDSSVLMHGYVDQRLYRCPDCYRPKARSADDCAAGCCSKWYAVRDKDAAVECEKLASYWRGTK